MMDVFATCSEINDLINAKNDLAARSMLIKLLDYVVKEKEPYPQVLNQLIRSTGLFPYLQLETATWDQKFVHKAFAVDVGDRLATLHREQSSVLSKLLDGNSIAVSAPTSFGKSFIIDAFIAAKRPSTVVIIVPTIALMDETRRRLYKKFSHDYNIITSPDATLSNRNIFIFPQERAFGYADRLSKIDLLVIDEFYKASITHDKERAPSLIKAIMKLSRIAKQRYYLAPNVKKMADNIFTNGMEFIELLDFNTVFLEKYELYKSIKGDSLKKGEALIGIISPRVQKTLIYAGTYSEINTISGIAIKHMTKVDRPHIRHFAHWLRVNYQQNWSVAELAERGIGVHNGRMHRCLSQLQVHLFELEKGFDTIVSTSSIIEGVNTCAQNVVVWKSKIGQNNLKDFTYKNIIGRGGRMFKHFVGHIYLLDAPPAEEETQLEISLPDKILGSLDETQDRASLTDKQVERVIEYKNQMSNIIGSDNFSKLKNSNTLQDSDSDFLLKLAKNMKANPQDWRGFGYLNSNNPDDWNNMLYQVVQLKASGWDTTYTNIVLVTKALSYNWDRAIPHILANLSTHGIDIEKFFQIERKITFKLAALLSDVNELHKIIVSPSVDVGGFIGKLSHAFLPSAVYHLEEYGLPRMISRKIHLSGIINLSDSRLEFRDVLDKFRAVGLGNLLEIEDFSRFDKYVVKFFFDGISANARLATKIET